MAVTATCYASKTVWLSIRRIDGTLRRLERGPPARSVEWLRRTREISETSEIFEMCSDGRAGVMASQLSLAVNNSSVSSREKRSDTAAREARSVVQR